MACSQHSWQTKSASLSEQVAPFSGNADGSSDWMKRLWFANYVENTPFPFRMVYNFSYNPQLDILVFEFFVARPKREWRVLNIVGKPKTLHPV